MKQEQPSGLDNQRVEELEHEEHWVAVSDLMGGLMMVFLLIALVFMVIVELERRKIHDVAVVYERLRTQLYEDLRREFADDLPRWGAELNKDLSIRFLRTELLFDRGVADLKPDFSAILADFFPRYVRIIASDRYRQDIKEVRIEGHTDRGWSDAKTPDDAYIRNMELSQTRTRTTLAYLLGLETVAYRKPWLKSHLTANGLSSSKPVLLADGSEDSDRSRRVEFRLRTDAESRIEAILREGEMAP
ncbi:OmpA family protein [Aestuariirhabdus sp. Z084]|uniref:OmpA/MotB family protein n=1 Tax=Aestuariirhabdus haliotis TaxID=2918751 RepID=UPI00201B3B5E|nr:OmpA family protein [Aestuariirhabdus haliotis]MCL6416542.1 OmpA family protein [Aestuariirhabdus haliotis]MCL6420532.1 OmpA family protein [Aestuariirhabdus haliotis]